MPTAAEARAAVSGRIHAGLVLVDLAFLASLVLVPGAWIMSSLHLPLGIATLHVSWHTALFAVPFGLLFLRLGWRAVLKSRARQCRGLLEAGFFQKVSLAVLVPFIFFVAIEQALQFAGFEAVMQPVVIRGDHELEYSKGDKVAIVPDDALRWRFLPGADFNGRPINRMGFPEREVDPKKSPGTTRIICMGDSCSGQGPPTYATILHNRLQQNAPAGKTWEAFNTAVHGYSSVQGLKLFELRVHAMQPDFVTLYYGWNDHWLCAGVPDRYRMGKTMSGTKAVVYTMLRKKRLGQLLVKIFNPLSVQQKDLESDILRVPPDDYVQTLTGFVAGIRATGAQPILLTAPRSKLTGHLVHNKQAKSVASATELHDAYIELTRQVARDTGTPLLDLAAIFSEEDTAGYFTRDGIHFTTPGRQRIAELLYGKIAELAE